MPKLLSTINTQRVEGSIRRALREWLHDPRTLGAHLRLKFNDLDIAFEHGQWWVTSRESGAAWSVVDAYPGYGLGFDFERVAEGEES